MPPLLLVLLVLLAGLAVLRARPVVALAVLVGAVVLVPGPLVVPTSPTPYLTVQHALVLAGVGRLLLGLADGSLPRSALRPTRVHGALLVLVLASVLLGVGLAPQPGPLGFAGFRAADLLDALLYLVVVLALVRQLPLGTSLRVGAGVLLAGVAVAAVEHVTGSGYGHFLFSRLPEQAATDAANPLSLRAGSLRVRAGAEFALQYAWLCVGLLPCLLVVAVQRRAWAVWAGGSALAVLLVVYWSGTRSAVPAVVVAVALTAALGRDGRLARLAGGAVVLAGLAYLAVPEVSQRLSASTDEGSIDIRFQRLAPILGTTAQHPFRGSGLGQLVASGFPTADLAFLLQYAELGAVGVALLVLVLVAALAQVARGLAGPERAAAAAATVGVVAFVASATTYDASTLLQSVHLLWFSVALGTVAAERGLPPAPAVPLALAVPAAAVAGAVGVVALVLAPVHVASESVVTTVPQALEASSPTDVLVQGERLLGTFCGIVTSRAAALPGVSVDCTETPAAGVGRLRVQAPTTARLDEASAALLAGTDRLPGTFLQVYALGDPQRGADTVWRTAPVWAALAGAGLVLLIPSRATRRSRPGPGQPRPARATPAPRPVPAPTAAPVAPGR